MTERSSEHPGESAAAFPLGSAAYVETLFEQWRADPDTLPETWRWFFQGFDFAMCPRDCIAARSAGAQARAIQLIEAYRVRGHWFADTNPLAKPRAIPPNLSPEHFGFGEADLAEAFDTGDLSGPGRAPLGELLAQLRATYCGSVGVEYAHIQDPEPRRWLQERMEATRNHPQLSVEDRREILDLLTEAEVFERSLGVRYPGQKRFSLEGAEAAIPAIHTLVEIGPAFGVEEIVIGMAHRGRLNVLVNILDKPYGAIFSEFEDVAAVDSAGGTGDVKYHKGYAADHADRQGRTVHLTLAANPSHLEAVDPVVLGKVRGKQRQRGVAGERWRVLPLLIHGDAAFAGQGMVAEVLNLSRLEGYRVGGTIHLVINNQIGFTTGPSEARSSPYPTDVAKLIEAPIFHVNGEDPEAVVHVMRLAMEFRKLFQQDAVVDLVCYRRYGHNEGDEPAFTQPLLYQTIRRRPTAREIYLGRLRDEGVLDEGQVAAREVEVQRRLLEAREAAPAVASQTEGGPSGFHGLWEGLEGSWSFEANETRASREDLVAVARALTTVPEGFLLNPKVARKLPEFLDAVLGDGAVSWSQAELLAFGTLQLGGNPVRLSGQDSARGTFSQRHATWQDASSGLLHVPLRHIREGQASFCVYNSMLSEAAVLGFDYGYTLAEPRMLVLWEAQFGDFSNGAQVIIDQFITSAEAKWSRSSGIVLLLPHGFEGQGPEHSNAYLERYLQACAEENIQVCNLTTPAQYFHALRRQVLRSFRKPLVLMAPKSLLRHPRALSPIGELREGRFHEILDDPDPPASVRRVVLCSGKVYYDLVAAREAAGVADAAILRVEQLYPLHGERLQALLEAYGSAEDVCWVQEEPRNRGAWTFIAPRLAALLPGRTLRYAGRPASASPATGSPRVHRDTQAALVREALGIPEEDSQ
ncbi:MAG: 2-oxoglutarate dehydrogenase E1 component [Pseudomonadota bacterium]